VRGIIAHLGLDDRASLEQLWGAEVYDTYGCNECGEQQTWLIGLTWLLTDYTVLRLNVAQSHITGGNGGNPPGSGFNKNNGADITEWVCAHKLTGKR